MSDVQCWEIDRLAARRLLSRLGVEPAPATVEDAATVFAEHRTDVEHWVAERVQSRILEALETRSLQEFGQKDENWATGFRAAEEMVAKLVTNDLLDQPAGAAQSKGQALRRMLRTARRRKD